MAATDRQQYYLFEVTDFNCRSMSKLIPARHKDRTQYVAVNSMLFTARGDSGAEIDWVTEEGLVNGPLVPDWGTMKKLPWFSTPEAEVWSVLCEQRRLIDGYPDEKLLEVIPRTLCKQMLATLRQATSDEYHLYVGGELEFYMSSSSEGEGRFVPMNSRGSMSSTPKFLKAKDFVFDLDKQMQSVGVDITAMHHEFGGGQLEVTFAPSFGIEAMDKAQRFRSGTKEIAQAHGFRATFMTTPFADISSGGHFNFSLWSGSKKERNAFFDEESPMGLSAMGCHFLAGVLKHLPGIEAFCSPTPACYKRHGVWAPTLCNWGIEDRLAAVRVKSHQKSDQEHCYMELRTVSAAANPYLVASAVIAAGLHGLIGRLDLPPPRQSKEQSALELPSSLPKAIEALLADDVIVESLGKEFVRWFIAVKSKEMDEINKILDGTDRQEADYLQAWRHMYFDEL
mmetsp:Transcript_53675/g.114584  ORF Transcript_53675/g.114584 Transcript_53675/m.114584 type:complete len:453 (+) Transcript_53675:55-1413(+)|eukprot:CAMPEP_0206537870 /NCGR_PEP_ID=MMETSP0325_2-20121206/7551_1 /ASSEMBLY_ACC=CAM_ASM_000347 /TAXON_ID=2866 /ORGANISM="Crypthecodinium cohnii, Strain Seligo" /LENGTH=452 /DNA_ID=CAMNT_0054035253 /DNA_START=54 /DNA_END=1412 /DNA_ORIENTATION=-